MTTRRKSLAAALVAGGLALSCAAGAVGAKELVFGSALPPQHNVNKLGLAPTLAAIEKATGGALKWKLLTGGQLFGLRASLTSVGGGMADAGIIIPSFVQSKLPHVYTMVDMAMFAEDPLAAAAASADTIFNDCPECLADFRKQKTVPLGFYALTTYKLLCNTKVTSLAEVKGKRMRTSGANGRWAKAMGGTPVSMSGSDMIEALQRGQIDCAIGPLGWIKAYSIAEHIDYVLDFPMGNFAAAAHFVMNRAAWDGLAPAQKKAILDAMPNSSAMTSIDGYARDEKIGEDMLRKRGAVFTKGGEEFADLMARHRESEMATIIAGAKKRRVAEPEKIIAAYRANVAKWRDLLAGKTRDAATFRTLLREQIYGKLDPAKL